MLVLLKYNLGTSALFQVKNENLKLGMCDAYCPWDKLAPSAEAGPVSLDLCPAELSHVYELNREYCYRMGLAHP